MAPCRSWGAVLRHRWGLGSPSGRRESAAIPPTQLRDSAGCSLRLIALEQPRNCFAAATLNLGEIRIYINKATREGTPSDPAKPQGVEHLGAFLFLIYGSCNSTKILVPIVQAVAVFMVNQRPTRAEVLGTLVVRNRMYFRYSVF